MGKPPIYVDLVEPNALTTAKHFRELRRKYSHPIIVMNLVKRREKRQECLLHEQLLKVSIFWLIVNFVQSSLIYIVDLR